MDLRPGVRVLDLGCGRGASSTVLRRDLGALVWSVDLWFSVDEWASRIQVAGVADGVDLYSNYVARFLRPGGQIGIAARGFDAGDRGPSPHLEQWWGPATASLRYSPESWRTPWTLGGVLKVDIAGPTPMAGAYGCDGSTQWNLATSLGSAFCRTTPANTSATYEPSRVVAPMPLVGLAVPVTFARREADRQPPHHLAPTTLTCRRELSNVMAPPVRWPTETGLQTRRHVRRGRVIEVRDRRCRTLLRQRRP
jgi:hypothetical protein